MTKPFLFLTPRDDQEVSVGKNTRLIRRMKPITPSKICRNKHSKIPTKIRE